MLLSIMEQTKRKYREVRRRRRTLQRKPYGVSSGENRKQYKRHTQRGSGLFDMLKPKPLNTNESTVEKDMTKPAKVEKDMTKTPLVTRVGIASGVGALAITTKIVATGVLAAGVASPVGPGIVLLLVLAHKLAEVYKTMKNLHELMSNIMSIVSSIYRLNNLIDVSNRIFFIYFYNFDNFNQLTELTKLTNNFI